MQSKYVLWRVSNGWILTYGNTIWEDADHLSRYAVFHSLKEFSDWAEVQPQSESKPKKVPDHGTEPIKAILPRTVKQSVRDNHKPKRANARGN